MAFIPAIPTTSGKGAVADIFGRRPAIIIGTIYTALYALAYSQNLGAGTPWIAVLAMTAGHALGARSMFGVQPSFYCDLFPPTVRCSAIAFAREVTGAVVLGSLPLVATALLSQYNGSALGQDQTTRRNRPLLTSGLTPETDIQPIRWHVSNGPKKRKWLLPVGSPRARLTPTPRLSPRDRSKPGLQSLNQGCN